MICIPPTPFIVYIWECKYPIFHFPSPRQNYLENRCNGKRHSKPGWPAFSSDQCICLVSLAMAIQLFPSLNLRLPLCHRFFPSWPSPKIPQNFQFHFVPSHDRRGCLSHSAISCRTRISFRLWKGVAICTLPQLRDSFHFQIAGWNLSIHKSKNFLKAIRRHWIIDKGIRRPCTEERANAWGNQSNELYPQQIPTFWPDPRWRHVIHTLALCKRTHKVDQQIRVATTGGFWEMCHRDILEVNGRCNEHKFW